MRKLFKFIWVMSSTILIACDGDDGDRVVDSTFLSSSRIYAIIDIYNDGGEYTKSSVQLTKDRAPRDDASGDEFIRLRGNDKLWFGAGESIANVDIGDDLFGNLPSLENRQELLQSESRGSTVFPFFFFWSFVIESHIFYNGSLQSAPDGSVFYVSLLRGKGDDAEQSRVTMPISFDLLSPPAQAQFSRGADEIQIEWMPMEDGVSVEASINTDCPGARSHTITRRFEEDDGLFTLNPGDLVHETLGGDCNTTVTLAKRKIGILDPKFIGGSISANQVRTISFTTRD